MLKPLNTYILVQVEPEQEKTAGGLYVPQGSNANATDILKSGKVLAVNDEIKDFKDGVTVYFNKHAITKVPGVENQVLVRKEDLYAVVTE